MLKRYYGYRFQRKDTMTFLPWGIIVIVLFWISGLAAQEDSTKQIVRVAPGFATVIVCPVAPELVTAGNVEAFSIQSAGNFVLIKPLVKKGETNLFIKTARGSYSLLLRIADKPDLEVRLPARWTSANNPSGEDPSSGSTPNQLAPKVRKHYPMTPEVWAKVPGEFRRSNQFGYSVANSNVVMAADYLKQIKDKLYVIATLVNNSSVPYDIGYISFKTIDYSRSNLFWRKKIAENELEPIREYYDTTVKSHTTARLIFIFEKHGFSDQTYLSINCNEASGQRDLKLEIPGTKIQ